MKHLDGSAGLSYTCVRRRRVDETLIFVSSTSAVCFTIVTMVKKKKKMGVVQSFTHAGQSPVFLNSRLVLYFLTVVLYHESPLLPDSFPPFFLFSFLSMCRVVCAPNAQINTSTSSSHHQTCAHWLLLGRRDGWGLAPLDGDLLPCGRGWCFAAGSCEEVWFISSEQWCERFLFTHSDVKSRKRRFWLHLVFTCCSLMLIFSWHAHVYNKDQLS